MPSDLKKALVRCAHERDAVCREELKVDCATGKKLLQAVLNGSALHAPYEANEFLKLLQKAAIYIRWLACSVLPDVYTLCKDDPKRKFPEASVVHFMWTAVQDAILTSWLGFVRQRPVSHLSLHYDGIRIDKEPPGQVSEFRARCTDHIVKETGFIVNIREKEHHYLFDLLKSSSGSISHVDTVHEGFVRPGNCVPTALMHLFEQEELMRTFLEQKDHHHNVYAHTRGHRAICT